MRRSWRRSGRKRSPCRRETWLACQTRGAIVWSALRCHSVTQFGSGKRRQEACGQQEEVNSGIHSSVDGGSRCPTSPQQGELKHFQANRAVPVFHELSWNSVQQSDSEALHGVGHNRRADPIHNKKKAVLGVLPNSRGRKRKPTIFLSTAKRKAVAHEAIGSDPNRLALDRRSDERFRQACRNRHESGAVQVSPRPRQT
jgi:hypothetical protein